jgi:hypothetical protein
MIQNYDKEDVKASYLAFFEYKLEQSFIESGTKLSSNAKKFLLKSKGHLINEIAKFENIQEMKNKIPRISKVNNTSDLEKFITKI